MPYVPVPKDLSKVKTKVAFNLTKRQLICFGASAVIGIPTYLLSKGTIGNTAAVLLMIGCMLPGFFFGMHEKDGLPAEKILKNYIRSRICPSERIYQTDNLYRRMSRKEPIAYNEKQTAEKARAAAQAKYSQSPTEPPRRRRN